MSISKNTINTLIAGAFAVSMVAASQGAAAEEMTTEKCYGVVKAGHNDCANADKSHSCAGQAKVNGSGSEFVTVAKGLCDKLVGGSMMPTDAKGTEPTK